MRRFPEKYFGRNKPSWYRLLDDGLLEMSESVPKLAVESFEQWKIAWDIKPQTNEKQASHK